MDGGVEEEFEGNTSVACTFFDEFAERSDILIDLTVVLFELWRQLNSHVHNEIEVWGRGYLADQDASHGTVFAVSLTVEFDFCPLFLSSGIRREVFDYCPSSFRGN